jgi:carbon storage regulator
MLVLKRKTGETIQLGDDVRVTVRQVQGDRVRLAITAPGNVPVVHYRLVMGDLQIDEDQIEQERDWSQVIPL